MKDLSVYVLVSFIACVTPGSGVLYTVTNGLRGGLRTVLASPLGTTLGVGLMSLISATGLGALITSSPALYAGLQLVSAAVLFLSLIHILTPATRPIFRILVMCFSSNQMRAPRME